MAASSLAIVHIGLQDIFTSKTNETFKNPMPNRRQRQTRRQNSAAYKRTVNRKKTAGTANLHLPTLVL